MLFFGDDGFLMLSYRCAQEILAVDKGGKDIESDGSGVVDRSLLALRDLFVRVGVERFLVECLRVGWGLLTTRVEVTVN